MDTLYLRSLGDGYFRWLADDLSLRGEDDHWFLLRQLHRNPFSLNPLYYEKDSHLLEDSKYLRHVYESAWGKGDKVASNMPTTCLEMILNEAYILESWDGAYDYRDYFWLLLDNLGLMKFSDTNFFDLGGYEVVDNILWTWISRTYRKDGVGSIYPLTGSIPFYGKNYKVDMRKLSIKEQRIMYMRDNYSIHGVYELM